MTNSYFVAENEDLVEFFNKEGIPISISLKSILEKISIKNSNNYVGYYQFKIDNRFFKIYILPKTIDKNSGQLEEKFLDILIQFYKIKYKYSDSKNHVQFSGNIIDYSIEIFNKLNNGCTLDNFIEYKYEDALNKLASFFRKHRPKEKRNISYHSQSINNILDIKKNVSTIDKSNIYQIKKEDFSYSKIAIIVERILKNFIFYKLPSVSIGNYNKFFIKSSKLVKTIRRNFELDKNYNFCILEIISIKVINLFKKSEELRKIHESLLIIVGLEHFNSEDKNIHSFKLENMTSLFFRPEKIYEWIVYDKLVSEYSIHNVLKDGFKCGTEKQYSLQQDNNNISQYTSRPDFIIESGNETLVVDTKWKILCDSPEDNDVLKLRRDVIIRQETQKPIRGLLIYPSILCNKYQNSNAVFNYDFDKGFKFSIRKYEI